MRIRRINIYKEIPLKPTFVGSFSTAFFPFRLPPITKPVSVPTMNLEKLHKTISLLRVTIFFYKYYYIIMDFPVYRVGIVGSYSSADIPMALSMDGVSVTAFTISIIIESVGSLIFRVSHLKTE